MRRTPKQIKLVDTDYVLAVAALVHRQNQGYHKDSDNSQGPVRVANKVLLAQYLEQDVQPTEQDQSMAQEIRQRVQGLLFKSLGNDTMSDFDRNLQKLATAEQTNIYDRYALAMLSYTPAWTLRLRQQDQTADALLGCERRYLADVGTKIQAQVRVIKSQYSSNWDRHFITGLTSCGCQVFFPYRLALEQDSTVDLQGWVKQHRDDFCTKLNRVRIQA